LDLFGAEVSTNAASGYASGIKGRFGERRIDDDHKLADATYAVLRHNAGRFVSDEVPALNALNERLRRDYVEDVERGLQRMNRVIADAGFDTVLELPHAAFNRHIGHFAGLHVSPRGEIVSAGAWRAHAADWLPSAEDKAYLNALMEKPVHEPGKFANWIAPPARGVNQQPVDFEFVRFN
ncbi:MAG: benzoyl-CoA 2,3-epoxidase subunit BoxB, partial [Gammaproteobacteria bacterium]